MQAQHQRKEPKLLVFRAAMVFVLALVFSVFSFSTVMANTVSANVVDGDKSYTFSMDSADLDRILAQAQRQGLEPLGPLDVAEQVENTTTVNIRRGVPMTVNESGRKTNLVAFRGDTIGKTLDENNILLGEDDTITPGADTVVQEALTVELVRSCEVTVTADGQDKSYQLSGGTVEDALQKAGVTLQDKDSANYDQRELLFNKMHIRVRRTVLLKVTEGGQTREYRVSAGSVRAALEKCGVELGDYDRVNVGLGETPVNGMEIVITRATVEERTEVVEVEYPTRYLESDELYEDEEELRTQGVNGKKELTYRVISLGGETESTELVSEEILEEPVPEVIVKGTMVRDPEPEPELTPEPETPENIQAQEFSYVDVWTGVCTAYAPENKGDLTSTGVVAGYGCIAVNPNVIPYGSLLYITSPDGSVVYGYGQAVDTGGAAMDGDILCDLCYETEEECIQFGRRTMLVYIIRWGY